MTLVERIPKLIGTFVVYVRYKAIVFKDNIFKKINLISPNPNNNVIIALL